MASIATTSSILPVSMVSIVDDPDPDAKFGFLRNQKTKKHTAYVCTKNFLKKPSKNNVLPGHSSATRYGNSYTNNQIIIELKFIIYS